MKLIATVIGKQGAITKMAGLLAVREFSMQIPRDCCSFLDENISSSVLNGQYVGYISGNLKRSISVEIISPFVAAVVSDRGNVGDDPKENKSIAPYTDYVRAWSEDKYGDDFYVIGWKMFEKKVLACVQKEWKRLKGVINSGMKYTYQNPFPA